MSLLDIGLTSLAEEIASCVDPKTGLVKVKLPAAIGPAVDAGYELRLRRLALAKLVDAMEKTEKDFKERLNAKFGDKLSGAAGKIGKYKVSPKEVPVLKDPTAFHKHIQKTGEFDLLQARLAEGAIALRWEQGKNVPGVDRLKIEVGSFSKADV